MMSIDGFPTPRQVPPPRQLPPAERAAAIGSRLRQIFDEAAAEPMPDAFDDLLRKLR